MDAFGKMDELTCEEFEVGDRKITVDYANGSLWELISHLEGMVDQLYYEFGHVYGDNADWFFECLESDGNITCTKIIGKKPDKV